MFSLLDQGVISLVLEPIKHSLHATDSQLGLLTGIAFGLFYATLAIPVARWADRGDRVRITSIALAVWGATVMLPVAVTSFAQLVLARVAAAVGAAGCMPPSYSLVGDFFPAPADRTRAMSVYMLAAPMSLLVSFALGGWVNEHYGWRAAFLVIGMPALLVALVVRMTIVEPRGATGMPKPDELTVGITVVLATLWRQRSARHLLWALVIVYVLGFGTMPWYAAFMMRSHHMDTAELGVWLGAILGIGGVAGALIGGFVCGRWLADNERGQMRFVAVTIVLLVPCFALFLLLQRKEQSLAGLLLLMVIWNMYVGPTFALLQRLVPDQMRATALAAVMFVCNLVGMGVGPQIVGSLSDWLAPMTGQESLRFALLLVSSCAMWSAYHFWQAGRSAGQDLQASGNGVISPVSCGT